MDDLIAIVVGGLAVAGIFGVLPVCLFSFLLKNGKHKREKEIEKMQLQKEILALEVQKQDGKLKLLETENRQLDKVIYDK